MSKRTAGLVSWGLLVAAVALLAVALPLSIDAINRMEPGRIVVVGDQEAPRMAEVRAELDARVAAGDDLVPDVNAGAAVVGVVSLLWLATGSVIVSRQPRNGAGWILVFIGLALPVLSFCESVMASGVRAGSGGPNAGAGIAAVVGEFALYPIALLPLLFLLFPDGRPPSPRWRWAAWASLGGLALALVGFSLRPGPLNNWVDLGILYENPLGVEALGELPSSLIVVGTVTALLAAFATVIAVLQRFHRSTGEERQQMRWLVFVAITAGVLLALMFLIGLGAELLGVGEEGGPDHPIFDILFGLVAFTVAVGVPAAYLIAIFRHGLWDLDVVIRKAVVFAVLAGFISLLYALVALGLPVLVVGAEGSSGPFTFAATVLLVLLFQPVRDRARHLADRLVYGKRATPYEVLTEFSGRMAETLSTEDVLPRMAQILGAGAGAERARVWLRVGNELRPAASWPADGVRDGIRMDGDRLPPLSDEHAVEVRHQGELLGALSVAMPANDSMNPVRAKLVEDLASQAGLVLRNVRLIEELRASRQRLVKAQDEERRRLERNIHDGAQQQLVALAMKLGLAGGFVEKDPHQAKALIGQLQGEAREALDDLRDLARGIYPPLLADQGLAAALESQARKSQVPVSIDSDGIGRYPQEAEAAVYFCTLEALQNVAKYAGATRAEVRLREVDGSLVFEVTDDGAGFDPAARGYGTGLQGMADRLSALGGELSVDSAPGRGTIVRGTVPTVTS